jgi:hypothetical protein
MSPIRFICGNFEGVDKVLRVVFTVFSNRPPQVHRWSSGISRYRGTPTSSNCCPPMAQYSCLSNRPSNPIRLLRNSQKRHLQTRLHLPKQLIHRILPRKQRHAQNLVRLPDSRTRKARAAPLAPSAHAWKPHVVTKTSSAVTLAPRSPSRMRKAMFSIARSVAAGYVGKEDVRARTLALRCWASWSSTEALEVVGLV